jgi:hypothetical protein
MQSICEGQTKHEDKDGIQLNQLRFDQYKEVTANLFEQTEIYKEIQRLSIEDPKQFLDAYLNDFVLMTCKIKTNQNLSIIKTALVRQLAERDSSGSLKQQLPTIHCLYEEMSFKIDMYLKFVNLTEDLVINQAAGVNSKNNDDDDDIDIQACLECMRLFKSNFQSIKFDFDINKNMFKLNEIIQLANKILVVAHTSTKPNRGLNSHNVRLIRENYEVLRILYMLVDNVLFEDFDNKQLKYLNKIVLCFLLVKTNDDRAAVGAGADRQQSFNLKHYDTFLKFNEYLLRVNLSANEILFYKNAKCKACDKKRKTFHRVTGCDCIICDFCCQSMSISNRCPSCKQVLPKDRDKHVCLYDDKDLQSAANEFNERLNKFYLNIIEYVLFDGDLSECKTEPDEQTIELLLEIISNSTFKSKNFDESFVLMAKYRSLLIQILFKFNSRFVNSYLSAKIFNKNATNLFEDVQDLALFYLNCAEDQLIYDSCSITNSNLKFKDLIAKANRLVDKYTTNDGNFSIDRIFADKATFYKVDYLHTLAEIKFFISELAHVANSYTGLVNSSDVEQVDAFIRSMQRTLQSSSKQTKILFHYLLKV